MSFILILSFIIIAFLIIAIIWHLKNPIRRKYSFTVLGLALLFLLIYNVFFVDHSMRFIQSKVYPNLYLVDNEISDRDSLNRIIKKMSIEKMNAEFIGNENKFKSHYKATDVSDSRTEIDYHIDFYTYFEGWGTDPFGQAGTAHFIENEEDPGGFSSEELSHYNQYRIASLSVQFCKNDTVNYYSVLRYYQQGNETISDTIISKCRRKN